MPTQQSSSRKNRWVAFIAGAMVVVAGAVVIAGPLDPPAGPVTGTYKTLSEVEPRIAINATNTPGDANSVFRITQPGSYYLTANVTGVVGKHGIKIESADVSIDLNGFKLIGRAGTLDGLFSSTFTGLSVRNGTISQWTGRGVNFQDAFNCRIEDLSVTSSGSDGIHAGSRSTVRNCIVASSGVSGIVAGLEAVIEGCVSRSNNVDGITVSSIATISRNVCRFNIGCGIRASGQGFSNITDNVVSENTSDGIRVARSCFVARNNCFGQAGAAGIRATGIDNRIEDNVCTINNTGMAIDGTGNFVVRNSCSGNTANNWAVTAGNAILVVNVTAAGAFSGNAGGTSPGSTDPNANFTY